MSTKQKDKTVKGEHPSYSVSMPDDSETNGVEERDPVLSKVGLDVDFQLDANSIRQRLYAAVPTSRSHITCFRCGESGHYKSECFHWRTRLCFHHMKGVCDDPFCSFAHGNSQLRSPWMPRCVRVVKHNGHLISLGCKRFGHTFKYCPYRPPEGTIVAEEVAREF